jgi:hypothetical protein
LGEWCYWQPTITRQSPSNGQCKVEKPKVKQTVYKYISYLYNQSLGCIKKYHQLWIPCLFIYLLPRTRSLDTVSGMIVYSTCFPLWDFFYRVNCSYYSQEEALNLTLEISHLDCFLSCISKILLLGRYTLSPSLQITTINQRLSTT